jgi:hypothetical protein
MILKLANCELKDIKPIYAPGEGNIKLASNNLVIDKDSPAANILKAEVKKHPNALFFKAKAIEADVPNNNGDSFSSEELRTAYQSFVGVPFFTNHQNQEIEHAKGKVIHADWDEDSKCIWTISFVDREAYPDLCRGIEQEYMSGVSMGCSVEYSLCSICRTKASTTEEYCTHIRNRKGRKFTGRAQDAITGETKDFKDALVYEDNYGIRFIELSGVSDPACPSCRIDGIVDNQTFMKAASGLFNECEMIKSYGMEKVAAQSDVDGLNKCLETIQGVTVKLVQNRQNIEMEFASDLVSILADLQNFVDELVQAGFGQLPEDEPAPEEGMDDDLLGDDVLGEDPAMPAPEGGMPQQVSEEESLSLGEPGEVSGEPGAPAVKAPVSPGMTDFQNTTRSKPKRSTVQKPHRPTKVISKASGESNMSKQSDAKDRIQEVLNEDWKEKLENISNKLSNILKNNENGGNVMADTDKGLSAEAMAGANTDNHVVTEKQLGKGSSGTEYHPRLEDERHVTTEEQLRSEPSMQDIYKQKDVEQEVTTEKQLENYSGLNQRAETEEHVITEKQLPPTRKEEDKHTVTQDQLEREGYKNNDEREVITERQLSDAKWSHPWTRSASATVGDHVNATIDTLAKTVLATGTTPGKAVKVASAMSTGTVSDQLAALDRIAKYDGSTSSVSDYKERIQYWGDKGLRFASSDDSSVEEAIVAYAHEVGADQKLDLEVMVETFAKLDTETGVGIVSDRVDEIMAEATTQTETVDIQSEIESVLQSKVAGDGDKGKKECGCPSFVDCECCDDCHCKECECDSKSDAEACGGTEASADEEAKIAAEAKSLAEALEKKASEEGVDAPKVDYIIEASADEIGAKESDADFKEKVDAFARGACASSDIKVASVVNVTVSDETVTIAVETDNESVEIPIGGEGEAMPEEAPELEAPDMEAPELDMPEEEPFGEDEGEAGGFAPPAEGELQESGTLFGLASNGEKKMKRKAQFGAAPDSYEGTGGGAAEGREPGEMATGEGAIPDEQPVGSFTEEGVEEELPGEGEQNMPGAVCPICRSDDTETGKKDQRAGQFDCNNCGVKYTYSVNVELLNPEEMLKQSEQTGGIEGPDAPVLPVAAFVDIDRNAMRKLASCDAEGYGCPACGSNEVEANASNPSDIKIACASCGTDSTREMLINFNDPKQSVLKVAWDLDPAKRKCKSCAKAKKSFASDLKFTRIMKEASSIDFPAAKVVAWVNDKYGDDAVVSNGPYKGSALASTVASQLERFALTKMKHLKALAEVQSKEDPMDTCLKEQKAKGYLVAEANKICNCLRDKYASEEDFNIYMQAFSSSMDEGVLRKMAAHDAESAVSPEAVSDDDLDIDAAIEDFVDVEVEVEADTKDIQFKTQAAVKEAGDVKPKVDKDVGMNVPGLPSGDGRIKNEDPVPDRSPDVPRGDAHMGEEKGTIPEGEEVKVPMDNALMGDEEHVGEQKSVQKNMIGHVAKRGNNDAEPDSTYESASGGAHHMSDDKGVANPSNVGPEVVKDIEGHDDVPRADAHMGHESETDPGMKDGPDVPRSDALMGHEGESIPDAQDPQVPSADPDSDVTMRGRVAERDRQLEKVKLAKREKAIRLASKMVAHNVIAEGEFEATISDLSALPFDRMEIYANKLIDSAASMRKEASTLSLPVVVEDRGMPVVEDEADEPTLMSKLAGMFTVGNDKASRLIKEDSE